MDLSKFLGSAFLKPVDLDEPIRVTIVDVLIGKYDKPDLVLSDGSKLSCNTTNARVLARAYGTESNDWLNKEVELRRGSIEFNGKPQDTILITPISPPLEAGKKAVPKVKPKKAVFDLDDQDDF